MINKTKKTAIFLIFLGLTLPIFSYAVFSPTVEIKANDSTSPITISYNTSVNLTWKSTNADSCEASGNWSGSLALSGSQTVRNIMSPQNFIITCTGSGGSTSATMVVNITNIPTSLTVSKLVQNISQGIYYSKIVSAKPSERLSFQIQITPGNIALQNIIVKDSLPSGITYLGNLKINGVLNSGNVTSVTGVNIGNLSAGQTATLTFDAILADSSHFNPGFTTLINSVLVYNSMMSNSDTARVAVSKSGGNAPTNISTGLSNNFFSDSFFLPLVMAILIIWLFKSHIINFEEWMETKKKEYNEYKAKKILQIKIAGIKTKEFFRNKL